MPADPQDALLREMAQDRGLKLVKSRRRTPGRGDYGHYGLADAKTGKPCFGFGKRGLTATPDEVKEWLRAETAAGWKRSVRGSPKPRH
jgi:hypothetical protein